jgi:ribonuclease HI
MPETMRITMFTDISLISAIGLGSYAVWAKESGQSIRHADVFKNPIYDSNVAETCGIINGLAIVLNHFKPPAGSRILAESDSETAIRVLQGSNRNPMFDGLLEARDRLLNDRGIMVIYLHVKGHSKGSTRREAVNKMCDRACREALRKHQAMMGKT